MWLALNTWHIFSKVIREELTTVLMNVTPAYASMILIDYLPYRISGATLAFLTQLILKEAVAYLFGGQVIRVMQSNSLLITLLDTALDLDKYQALVYR